MRPITIHKTNYLHVDVQWHHMEIYRQLTRECIADAKLLNLFAKRFLPGHWSFLGLGSEAKRSSTYNVRPGVVSLNWWSSSSEIAYTQFSEPRVHCPEERSEAKEVEISIHFCAEWDTIEIVFRTMISVNQFSSHWAVSDLCEEYSACWARTERHVLAGQFDPLFEPVSLRMKTLAPSTEVFAQENFFRKFRMSGKAFTTRSIDQDLYWFKIFGNSWGWTVLHDKTLWWVLTHCSAIDTSWAYFTTSGN